MTRRTVVTDTPVSLAISSARLRSHQGVINDPPALSNPRAWIQFHATFDVFHWIMSCGSCDSRSHNRSSSLLSSISPLYHTERKLVLTAAQGDTSQQVDTPPREAQVRSSSDVPFLSQSFL